MFPYFEMGIIGDTNCDPLLKVPTHVKEGNHFVICKILQICELHYRIKCGCFFVISASNSALPVCEGDICKYINEKHFTSKKFLD